VHHAFYLTDAYGLMLAGRMRRRPLVFSWHGVPGAAWWEANQRRKHHWYKRMARRADCISVMTAASARRFREDYGGDPVVLTPGIFVDDYTSAGEPQSRRTIVCSAAVDDPHKRIGFLIDAFAQVARSVDDVELLLIGHGDPTAALRQAQALGPAIAPRVRWEATTDVASACSRCTVGALTSVNEAFGLVVLEYLASGMPAVVTEDGGAADILTSDTGATFREGDVEDCARALVHALELAADPRTEGLCRARARDFDWHIRGDAYEDLYQRLA
jgi:glycosyltransferase involved in cell wall biosynthesis